MTIEHGRRCSAAVAYLRPALSRPNLTVEIKALATRLLFDGARAVGVEYIRHGEKTVVRAEREVILSGGVDQLAAAADALRHRRPRRARRATNPGASSPERRRQEPAGSRRRARHLRAPPRRPLPAQHAARPPGLEHRPRLRVRHRLRNQPAGWAHRIPQERFEPADSRHPAALHRRAPVRGAALSAAVLAAIFRRLRLPAVVLRPESRGQVRLASADPRAAPRIQQNLLATDRDWNSIRAGIRLVRELAHQPALQPFIKTEIGPGPAATSDEAIDAHIRATAVTAHHPAGTCRMGTDATGGRRPGAARARDGRSARRRCVGVSRSGRRQHQCACHHDRRESGRPDPRPYAVGAGSGGRSRIGPVTAARF